MNRILEQQNIAQQLIPAEEFVLYRDVEKRDFPGPESSLGKQLVEAAENLLAEEIPAWRATLFMRFRKDGNRSEHEALYFARRIRMVILVAAEQVEKQGRFVDAIIDLMWNMLEETTWVLPAHHGKNLPVWYGREVESVDLFSTETGANLAMAYYYMKDAILERGGEILLDRLRYEVDRQVLAPFLKMDAGWMGFTGKRVNNWNPWIASSVLTCTALLEEDDARRAQLVDKVCRMLDNYIAGVLPDGGCDEGPNYWTLSFGTLYDCLELLYDMTGGAVDLFGRDEIHKMMESISKIHINGTYLIPYGDAHARTDVNGMFLRRVGRRINSRVLEGMGAHLMPAQPVINLNKAETPHQKNNPMRFYRSIVESGTVNSESTYEPACFAYLPVMQLCMLREKASATEGFCAWLKGGSNGEFHNHNDVGSVGLYRNGRPVLIDLGVGEYTRDTFSSNRYSVFPLNSCDHNLPLIDGIGQLPGKEYCTDFFEAEEATMTARVGLANAYGNREDVVSYTRELSVQNNEVQLTEDMEFWRAMEVEFRLNLYHEPELRADGCLDIGEGAMLHWDESLELSVERIEPESRLQSDWSTENFYRLHFKTRGPVEKLQVQFIIRA